MLFIPDLTKNSVETENEGNISCYLLRLPSRVMGYLVYMYIHMSGFKTNREGEPGQRMFKHLIMYYDGTRFERRAAVQRHLWPLSDDTGSGKTMRACARPKDGANVFERFHKLIDGHRQPCAQHNYGRDDPSPSVHRASHETQSARKQTT
jgi:hypothetical protein